MSTTANGGGVSAMAAAITPPAIDGNLTGRHIVSVEQFARPDLDDVIQRSWHEPGSAVRI